MDFEIFRNYLSAIQNDSFETRTLNAILTCFEGVKNNQRMIIELQQKVNEIIGGWNEKEGQQNAATENAEALSPVIEEDSFEQVSIDDYMENLENENDALVEQSPLDLSQVEKIEVEE